MRKLSKEDLAGKYELDMVDLTWKQNEYYYLTFYPKKKN